MASVLGQPLGLINLGASNPGLKRIQNNGVIVSSPGATQLPVTQIKTEDRGTVLVTNNNNNNANIANNNPNSGSELLRCKRRINFAYSNMANHQPASVARRNARERNRVKQVNNGFATLRSHIPVSGSCNQNAASRAANKKLSKVETLRMAVDYIRSLKEMLDGTSHTPTQGYYPSDDSFKLESLSPTCSENSSSPPPSSYTSEGSYNTPNAYAPMSPEDEDLLDVISLWQQSQ